MACWDAGNLLEGKGLLLPLRVSCHMRRERVPLSRTAENGWERRVLGNQAACTGLLRCVGESKLGLKGGEGKHVLSVMQKIGQILLKTLLALWPQHVGTCSSHWIIQKWTWTCWDIPVKVPTKQNSRKAIGENESNVFLIHSVMRCSPSIAENSSVTSQSWECNRKSEDNCVEAVKLSYPALQETKILSRPDKKRYFCFPISYNFEGRWLNSIRERS